jgi:hypothetical protein
MEENKGSETELMELIIRMKGQYSGYCCEIVQIEDLQDYSGDEYEWIEGAFEVEVNK